MARLKPFATKANICEKIFSNFTTHVRYTEVLQWMHRKRPESSAARSGERNKQPGLWKQAQKKQTAFFKKTKTGFTLLYLYFICETV